MQRFLYVFFVFAILFVFSSCEKDSSTFVGENLQIESELSPPIVYWDVNTPADLRSLLAEFDCNDEEISAALKSVRIVDITSATGRNTCSCATETGLSVNRHTGSSYDFFFANVTQMGGTIQTQGVLQVVNSATGAFQNVKFLDTCSSGNSLINVSSISIAVPGEEIFFRLQTFNNGTYSPCLVTRAQIL